MGWGEEGKGNGSTSAEGWHYGRIKISYIEGEEMIGNRDIAVIIDDLDDAEQKNELTELFNKNPELLPLFAKQL